MRLLHLHLENYCQHTVRDVDFHEGVNALIGSNGVGKSNLLNAVVWALTGVDRNAGKNADNVNLLAGPREPARVVLELEHAGTRLTLERRLRPAGQTLTVGTEVLSKDKDIATRLAAILTATPDLLLDYVFVAQWGMFDFLSHTEARRADAFGQLFGLGRAETIYRALTETRLQVPPVNLDLPALETRLRDLQCEAAEAASRLAACPELPEHWRESDDPAHQLLVRYQKEQERLAQRQHLLARLEQIDTQIRQQQELRTAKESEVQAVQQLVSAELPAARHCQEELARLEPYRRELARREDLCQRLAALDAARCAEPVPPADYIAATDPVCEIVAGLEQERYRLQRFLSTFKPGDLPECPTCGTATETVRDRLPEAETRLGELDLEIGNFQDTQERSQRYRQELAAWQSWQQADRGQRNLLLIQLQDLNELPPPAYSEESLRARLQEVEELQAGLNFLQTELFELEKSLAGWRGRRMAVEVELEHIPPLPVKMVSDQEAAQAQADLTQHAGLARTRLELQAEARRIAILSQDAQHALDKARQVEQQANRTRAAAGHLETVRQLFHREQLPRRVVESQLELLRGDINLLLESFRAPFRCAGVEGLRFRVRFHDGREHPAERLSGGLKVLFALAFRVAVNALFAGEVNLLCLDEPTVGLDRENRACLREALTRLRELSRQRGLQVILVTHEQGPELCDRVIDLAG